MFINTLKTKSHDEFNNYYNFEAVISINDILKYLQKM